MLALTRNNWKELYRIPGNVDAEFVESINDAKERIYDIVFLDSQLKKAEFANIRKKTKAYTVFYTEEVVLDHDTEQFLKSRKAQPISTNDLQSFFDLNIRNYYTKPYGEKYSSTNLLISSSFTGQVSWNGGFEISIEGEFGEDYRQIAYWKNRIPVYKGQCIEFYLEHEKQGDVSIQLEITQYAMGSVDKRLKVNVYTEEQLSDLFYLDNEEANSTIFISIKAKGKGKLVIKNLHDRYSRRGIGAFIPGGERYTSKNGEEVLAYFDPGDMKPPLNVYFSGFKLWEGFEGYNMLKSLGAPFLLFAEPRLGGGAFYLGEEDYEKIYVDVINSKMAELGFKQGDIIMSGISMGSTGALYYSCDVRPHAIIVGKPLASLGNVARNEITIRPGGFMESLNVLNKHEGGMDEECAARLNNKIWTKINKADFSQTTFVLSYMIEDDFDRTAYNDLIDNFSSAGVVIYGRGIHGRHNDNGKAIIKWFKDRFKSILREDYKRDI